MNPMKALPTGAFNISFKNLGIDDEMLYSDPLGVKGLGAIDYRPMAKEVLMKAMDTTAGGAGTAGYGMIPIYVDPNVVDRTRKYTPAIEIIPKVANMGTTAEYNVITAKGAADFKNQDAALPEQDDTFDRASTAIKYCYAVGRVTGPAQAATPSYVLQAYNPSGSGLAGSGFASGAAPNAKQLEVLIKSRTIAEEIERVLFNGDVTTYPEEFDGIVNLQSTTNKVDMNTTALTLEDIDTAVQYAFDDGGRPNVAFCDSSTYKDVKALIEDRMRTAPSIPIWGTDRIVLNTMVGQIPVIPSQQLSAVSGSKSLYLLDLGVWEQRVLMDVTYEDLAKTNDSEKFMLKWYGTLICKATAFNAFVGEIA